MMKTTFVHMGYFSRRLKSDLGQEDRCLNNVVSLSLLKQSGEPVQIDALESGMSTSAVYMKKDVTPGTIKIVYYDNDDRTTTEVLEVESLSRITTPSSQFKNSR